jgi:streptogramin lyase
MKVNALANVLNSCVAAVGASSACSTLFSATAGNSSVPLNTLDAAFRLARNPGVNIATLYSLSASSNVYSPTLGAAPSDWTVSINFGGGGMNQPTGIGVDSQGNVWVASYWSVASKFTPTGSPVFASGITGNGLKSSSGLAIDSQNNVWIPNQETPTGANTKVAGSVTVLNSSGQPLSGANGYIAGGIAAPIAVAIDPNGNVWVVNYTYPQVTLLSSSGAPLSGTNGYTAPSLAFAVSVVVDANHNGWIGNFSDSTVTRFSSDGSPLAVSCCSGAQALAIDQRGYIWASNYYGASVSQFSTSGTVVSPGYNIGAISGPQGIAVDGAGTVWAASVLNASVAQLAGSNSNAPGSLLSPTQGWRADDGLLRPYAVAIDASGNLWITNSSQDTKYANSNSITELIGMASPVKTPVIGPPQAP